MYNPGQKYMVHLENLQCSRHLPCSMMKAALFPNLGPLPSPPIQCCFTGDTLGKLIQLCMGGEGEGVGEMGKLSKKATCAITFGQDCRCCCCVDAFDHLRAGNTLFDLQYSCGLSTVCRSLSGLWKSVRTNDTSRDLVPRLLLSRSKALGTPLIGSSRWRYMTMINF